MYKLTLQQPSEQLAKKTENKNANNNTTGMCKYCN